MLLAPCSRGTRRHGGQSAVSPPPPHSPQSSSSSGALSSSTGSVPMTSSSAPQVEQSTISPTSRLSCRETSAPHSMQSAIVSLSRGRIYLKPPNLSDKITHPHATLIALEATIRTFPSSVSEFWYSCPARGSPFRHTSRPPSVDG